MEQEGGDGGGEALLLKARGPIVIVMRHGERRDGEPNATPENDPPLTPAGVKDVARAAERVKHLFGSEQVQLIQLISSPFLRTRQTAEALRANGIGTTKEIKVDNTLSEVYGPVRIKTGGTHSFENPEIVRQGAGKLPEWGESLEEAADRFCESLLSNANAAAKSDCIRSTESHSLGHSAVNKSRKMPVTIGGAEYVPMLITHGDALGSIVHRFYPSRIVYRADYLSFLVLERLSPVSSAFRILHAEDVEWILDGDDITPEELDLVLHAEEEEEAQRCDKDPNHPKWNEGCESGCPPSVRAQISQPSINARIIGQPGRLSSERNCFGNISPASLTNSTLLCGTFFNTVFVLLQLITMDVWKCKTADILFGVLASIVVQSVWWVWMLWVFWYRYPLHRLTKRILIGSGSISSYSPVESPRENSAQTVEVQPPQQFDLCEQLKKILMLVYSGEVILLFRVVRLTMLKITLVFVVGCILCLAMSRGALFFFCFISQFTHWQTGLVFLLSFTALLLASWFDLHILIAVAQL